MMITTRKIFSASPGSFLIKNPKTIFLGTSKNKTKLSSKATYTFAYIYVHMYIHINIKKKLKIISKPTNRNIRYKIWNFVKLFLFEMSV